MDEQTQDINRIWHQWYDSLSRRQKLMRWLQMGVAERWGDWVYNHEASWPRWATRNWVYGPTLPPQWLCNLLRAHCVIDDQCGMPEHRYCCFCNAPMPNQEVT